VARLSLRPLGLWKEKRLVSRRILAYDTTNFYTYVASTNERNHLAQRGHNKPGCHNLRQVGLSVEQFLAELGQIRQFVLLYPPLGDKGPNRVATVLSKQSLAQQALAESLGLEQICSTQWG
jgi:hypothetical protein